jgi:Dolichyl-phosphate-mannose-protein mannosyltransferase
LGQSQLLNIEVNPSVKSANNARVFAWLIFVAVLAGVVLARVHLLGLPLERDEGEYAYTGQLLLQGIPPYQLAYSMKFPGTAVAYAVLMSIFGETGQGIHFGLITVNVGTTIFVLLIGRRLFGEIAGITAAAAFSVLTLMPYVLGQAAHATHFVLLPAAAGCLALLSAVNRSSNIRLVVSGTLFGVAALMKQPGLFLALFGAAYLFGRDLAERAKLRSALLRNLLFLSGVATPLFVTGLILWRAGVFEKFWFWTISYTQNYAREVPIRVGLRLLTNHFPSVVAAAWPIWVIAGIGLIGSLFYDFRRTRGFLVELTFFGIMAVCAGFYFRPHYFILLLLPVSLLAGNAVRIALTAVGNRRAYASFTVILLFGLALVWPIWKERDFLFERSIAEANRMVNGTNPFPESVRIAEFIREQSTPSDTIAVLGSEPQIYFYAKRHSATGYIYTYGLMEPQPFAKHMQQEMIQEIERARPKFVVLVVMNRSWLVRPDSDLSIFKWATTFCDVNYDEVALINISDNGTDYYLSGHPSNVTRTPDHILVYQRKG